MIAFGHDIVIAEDLVLRDLKRCSSDVVINSTEQHPRSLRQSISESFSEGCSSSSKPYIDGAYTRIGERRAHDTVEELILHTRSEFVNTNNSNEASLFIFEG